MISTTAYMTQDQRKVDQEGLERGKPNSSNHLIVCLLATKMARKFLKLDNQFLRLHRILNRNTINVSYTQLQ